MSVTMLQSTTGHRSVDAPQCYRSSINSLPPLPADDLLKVIPHELLDKQCSEILLCDVAKDVTDWQLLLPWLKMNKSDENDLSRNHPGNNALQKQKLLLQWQEKFGQRATHRALVTAIYKSGDVDCAWKVCQMVIECSVEEAAHTPSSPLMGASIPPPAMAVSSTSGSPPATAMPSPAAATAALSKAMRKYQKKLKQRYKNHKPVLLEEEWPQLSALKYISLAMIKKETVERGSITNEYICTTIHGNMDDILHEKVPVEVDQLFSLGSDERQAILVEGAPGSGKSTLLWHICQKWQSGELFQQFILVLLVLLRDTAVHTAQSLADILPCIPSRSSKYTPSEYRKAIASDIEDRDGEGVLIMLDGWDEAPADLRQEGSLFHDIIADPSKCSVEAAAVVVSSRPSASDAIRKYASTRVEVLGFTRERREEYIRESLPGKPEAAHSLLQQIESVPQLGANCHLPLNLAIITHTFQCLGNTLPSTYCRIIITLALSRLLRHIQKSPTHGTVVQSLESFDNLPDGTREEFLKLCKLAYKGVVKEKYSFSSEDLREITQSSATGVPQITTFGLLQAVHSLVATGSSTVYHFLHLSLQELCAAYHISSLPSPETEHVGALKRMVARRSKYYGVPQYIVMEHFQPVCEFYSAMTHLHNPQVVSQLFQIYKNIEIHNFEIKCHHTGALLNPQLFFACLAEAENPDLSCVTANIIGTQVNIQSSGIGRALAMAIEEAPHLESVICYDFSPALSKALSGKTSLKHLEIHASKSTDMKSVKHVLTTCTNLDHIVMRGALKDSLFHLLEVIKIQTLDLRGEEIGEAGIVALSSALKMNTTIQHLTISCGTFREDHKDPSLEKASLKIKHYWQLPEQKPGCVIGEDGMEALSSALSINTTLKCLNINGNNFGDKGASHLAKALGHTSLQEIDISNCGIGEEGMVALSSALSTNTTLECLLVHGNSFGDKGVSHLAVALGHTSLQEIDISDCGIGEEGMVALSSALKTNTTLKRLKAYGNNFGDKGATHLAKALSHTSLQEIDISLCGIGEEGMVALSSALSTNTTLNCLKTYWNEFGDKGASHLAVALSHTSLQEIDISCCCIGEEGMVALSSALSTNTTLKQLDISGNNSKDKGIVALSSALSSNTTLTHLNIFFTDRKIIPCIYIGGLHEIIDHSQVALARALLQNTTLTSLSSILRHGRNGLTQNYNPVFTREVTRELLKDTSTFYASIKRSHIIQFILLDKTSSLGEALWSGNMEEAAEILKLNQPPAVEKTLKIKMSNNTWEVDYGARKVHETDEGLLRVRSIYNDPTSWSSLRELSLGGMVLGGVGACLLAEMLNETQIQTLDITYCDIPEDGIMALSKTLSINTRLKHLAIGGNRINKRGQEALVRALTRNTTLAVLDISGHSSFHMSFEDNGKILFQSLNQFSLSTIVNDRHTSPKEECAGWRGKIIDWKTF